MQLDFYVPENDKPFVYHCDLAHFPSREAGLVLELEFLSAKMELKRLTTF